MGAPAHASSRVATRLEAQHGAPVVVAEHWLAARELGPARRALLAAADMSCAVHGIEVRLTPDITRSYDLAAAELVVRYAAAYRERGVVGVGLGGPEVEHPPAPFERVFRLARDNGLGSVPHAGEFAGADSIRDSLERLGANRIRHGIRAVEEPGLVRELADRRTVLDVCPISNVRLGAVRSLEEHPLPDLTAAGVPCSLSTDDPALFGTNLEHEYETAASLGLRPHDFYAAGVEGALCDVETRERLHRIGQAFDWDALPVTPRTLETHPSS